MEKVNNKICLIIVFNHKYENNISKLKKYYKDRFSNIRFLMPFYLGNAGDVIGVFESSYQFQGYFAQAFNRFYDVKYTHYVIIGDDLLLNPTINEDNICEVFKANKKAYIHSLSKLSDMSEWNYARFHSAYMAFKDSGVNYQQEIPTIEQAEKKAKKWGLANFEIKHVKKFNHTGNIKSKIKASLLNSFTKMDIKYPLVAGYSDIIIIHKDSIKEFCRLSGVFAAMNLFVEIAIPTAMMLSCDNISMAKDLSLKAEPMWEPKRYMQIVNDLEVRCNKELDNIIHFFPQDYLYIHPIKMSRWK